jgi:cyclase
LIAQQGFGELFINFINRDGMYTGYDVAMIVDITDSVNCPVTVCGGCRDYNDIWNLAKSSNVSGIAAGSIFVYRNQNKGVLINYPSIDEIEENLGVQL